MNQKIIYLFLSIIFFSGCSKNSLDEEFRICGTSCTAPYPWTVETLDTGLPCFPSQDSCQRWAASHGYGNKNCVMCN